MLGGQTAITSLLGRGLGIFAAVLICLVVAGSLLGNSFVAGRMAVAAANAKWLPEIFSVVGRVGPPATNKTTTTTSSSSSSPPSPEEEEETCAPSTSSSSSSSSASDAPINAILFNTVLSTLFIFLGDFRSLVTFNGLGEYTFFFLTVLGAVVLRRREPALRRPYRPLLLLPVVFTAVSGFVLARGAVFAPAQALVLVAVWVLGALFYGVRRRWGAAATS